MITTAHQVVDRLREWIATAAERGRVHHCTIQLRIEGDGLLVVAASLDDDHTTATLVPWLEMLASGAAVPAAVTAVAVDLERQGTTA
jgi:hypothetical protein